MHLKKSTSLLVYFPAKTSVNIAINVSLFIRTELFCSVVLIAPVAKIHFLFLNGSKYLSITNKRLQIIKIMYKFLKKSCKQRSKNNRFITKFADIRFFGGKALEVYCPVNRIIEKKSTFNNVTFSVNYTLRKSINIIIT